ncbi:MAG: arsenate reductase ArsC [Pseudohongiella sp.]|jgi:arsenate reductase (thioredoxin)|nr:arsenate reductase ArsC [Pseudohongiella sp.]
MKKILLLCTGNSCRSIIAEALINQLGAGTILACSAGSKPTGFVHPRAIASLKRNGIACAEPRSKSWDEFVGSSFDLLLTVCDNAANETCPNFQGELKKLHWSIPDPAQAEGVDEVVDQAFDDVLQRLRERIEKELL